MESAKKEKITPAQKPVGSVGKVAEVSHEHLTTPRQHINGETPWGKESKEGIL